MGGSPAGRGRSYADRITSRAQRRSRYAQGAADTKTAVTQTLVYAPEKNVYPTSVQALRDAGLASLSDDDPWGTPFQLSPDLLAGNPPGGESYIFSKGPYGTGIYPNPFTSNTGAGGSVGYSSVYGTWTGSWTPGWPVFPSSAVLPARATTLRARGAAPLRGPPLAEGRRRPARSIGCKGWGRISAPDPPGQPKGY